MQTTTLRRMTIAIHGVGYGPAAARIEQELLRVPGVVEARVTPATSTAAVACEATTGEAALLVALTRIGFRAEVASRS